MRTNTAPKPVFTHEGAPASHIKPLDELKRTVMACMLFESTFYESGESAADRIKRLVAECSPEDVAILAVKARKEQKLRHVPLLLVREMARTPSRCRAGLISETLVRVIQRADELSEFLAIYWKEGKKPLAKQVKKGLAQAFLKFGSYALAKYDRANAIRLRDVAFLVHVKPLDEKLIAKLVNKTFFPEKTKGGKEIAKLFTDGDKPGLESPDTWEVALSRQDDKKATFERMLNEGTLGYMALLRNLRNMQQVEVDSGLVFKALSAGAAKSKALPFRYVAAARAVPAWEAQIDVAMQVSMAMLDQMSGSTVILVDVSGSMDSKLSQKSDLTRIDAASALAVLVRGVCESVRVFTFSDRLVEVPPRNGMALIDAISKSQPHGGTLLGGALAALKKLTKSDRLIVITDEQSHDAIGKPEGRGYIINVGTDERGVGYGDWLHINGFSEAVVQYILEFEKA